MKKIAILGSTGSIGSQTLSVVREHPECFQIVALAAGRNIQQLFCQICEFHPQLVSLEREEDAEKLKKQLTEKGIYSTEVLSGMEGLVECAVSGEAELVLNAVVGMLGICPTISAINAGKDIALANKETLVTAGHIIMPLVKEKKVKLLPVDSEHSAVFQCLQGKGEKKIEKLLLTASGGPFFGKRKEELQNITVEQALNHPNWSMGKKITIDSATMVNKGLEVMEAGWLFSLTTDQIQVVIQPKSIIHSMVQFSDGAVLAQLGAPDMRVPIQYALSYPNRMESSVQRLDFFEMKKIEFFSPDTENFPALALACDVFKEGGSLPTVFNAANERAVSLFLERKISFLQIASLIADAVEHHRKISNPSLLEVLSTEKETYCFINQKLHL